TTKQALEQGPAKPQGFKPLFKAGITKPAAPAEPNKDLEQQKPGIQEPSPQTDTTKQTSEQDPVKPLGFKPRFKPGVTKPAAPAEPNKDLEQQKPDIQEPSPQTDTTKQASEQDPAKPLGFKPRFKAGVTKPAAPAEPNTALDQHKPDIQEPSPQTDTTKQASEQDPAKPLGFKPRFKAGVTKPAAPAAEPNEDLEQQKPDIQESSPQIDTTKQASDSAKPLGFKPRFKPGITTNK